jgi:hypothetical protein
MPVAERPQMEKIIDQRVGRRPEGRHILNIWSNGKDTQLKMPVGKVKKISKDMDRHNAGAHEQEFMNFSAKGV